MPIPLGEHDAFMNLWKNMHSTSLHSTLLYASSPSISVGSSYELYALCFWSLLLLFPKWGHVLLLTLLLYSSHLSNVQYEVWRYIQLGLLLSEEFEDFGNHHNMSFDNWRYYFVLGKNIKELTIGIRQWKKSRIIRAYAAVLNLNKCFVDVWV